MKERKNLMKNAGLVFAQVAIEPKSPTIFTFPDDFNSHGFRLTSIKRNENWTHISPKSFQHARLKH